MHRSPLRTTGQDDTDHQAREKKNLTKKNHSNIHIKDASTATQHSNSGVKEERSGLIVLLGPALGRHITLLLD